MNTHAPFDRTPAAANPALAALLAAVERLARRAGAAILEVYGRDDLGLRHKDDRSPVTDADVRAESVILDGLRQLDPDVPVVSEEAVAAGHEPVTGERFWLVDPLDGTREFIARNGEFTVNIARIEGGRPVLGVVYAPAQDRLWSGAAGLGSQAEAGQARRIIVCRRPPAAGLVVLTSRAHGDPLRLERHLAGAPVERVAPMGSSLKFGLIAAGEADHYPRFGRTMEWDTAAGHAVLAAAGGAVETLDGQPLRYGKPGFENPDFIARGAA